jgi:hypothetical protein
MKMSGRPPAMFRPEIINQLRVLEFVLHFRRALCLGSRTQAYRLNRAFSA